MAAEERIDRTSGWWLKATGLVLIVVLAGSIEPALEHALSGHAGAMVCIAVAAAGSAAWLAWCASRGSLHARPVTPGDDLNLLRTVIDNLPDFIYVKDADCRFRLANAAVARQMGAASPQESLTRVSRGTTDCRSLRGSTQSSRGGGVGITMVALRFGIKARPASSLSP